MNVSLGTSFDQFVDELVKRGDYQSNSEVIREGLRLLKEREELRRERLRREIAIGADQLDRGDVIEADAAFNAIREKSKRRRS